jgi:hypothetical protein
MWRKLEPEISINNENTAGSGDTQTGLTPLEIRRMVKRKDETTSTSTYP